MNKFLPALLLSAVLAGAAIASAHAEVPGEDEGRNAAITAVETAHTVQMAQPVPQGRAGAPVAARDMSPMPTHAGC